jgi:small GTP-binding protein
MAQLTKAEITKMRIKRIEKEIRDTPYHKGTEHHIGRLRAKLSRLKESEIETSSKKGGGSGYAVKKQGDATVVLVGPPSAGKSTLLNKLTNAKSKMAPYEFTTVKVIPGMMHYKDAKIQILDVPGLIEGAEAGKGRGREVISVIRNSDLLIVLCDVDKVNRFKDITIALEKSGIRINKKPPDIVIEMKLKGGIKIYSNVKQELSNVTIKQVAKEFRVTNAEITLKEKLTIETLIDAFSQNRVYIPAIYVVNKIDLQEKRGGSNLNNPSDRHEAKPLTPTTHISSKKGYGLDLLKEETWKKLKFIRVYLVRKDEKPNKSHPMIVKEGDNLSKVAEKIGEEFAQERKRAKIWGSGSKFPGQEVSLSTNVVDGLQVRFMY